MSAFLLGIVLSILPGLITGWIGWSAMGSLMHRSSYCRHPISDPMVTAAPIRTVAERVRPKRPAVASATDLRQLAVLQAPQPARPQVVMLPMFMPLTASLQTLPQWPSHEPITLDVTMLESGNN